MHHKQRQSMAVLAGILALLFSSSQAAGFDPPFLPCQALSFYAS